MESEVEFVAGPVRAGEQREALEQGSVVESRTCEVGAVVEFHGVVRGSEGAEKIAGLFYEAYEPMARREFDRIFAELRARHSIQRVIVRHSLGGVPVGEASLFVRVEAKHRGPALAFCGELIDRMKDDVPIWKSPMPASALAS